jgi:hypothetical protein
VGIGAGAAATGIGTGSGIGGGSGTKTGGGLMRTEDASVSTTVSSMISSKPGRSLAIS